MVRIFFAGENDCAVWTNLRRDEAKLHFGMQLGMALHEALETLHSKKTSAEKIRDFTANVMQRAIPVALKTLGYQADEAVEQRTIFHGPTSWSDSQLAGQGGITLLPGAPPKPDPRDDL